MKKIFLIKNPELFQGKKYMKTNKDYFEGWYFKNTNNENNGIAFIPGISMNKQCKKAFIQVITKDTSYFIEYNINDFLFNDDPFYIKIGNSFFSKNELHIDISDEYQKFIAYGDIKYSDGINIATKCLSPNIMGPFAYIPFMECNHAILSMKNKVNGLIKINNKEIKFNNGIGYIEKDWGCSFPSSYIWCQGNEFENSKVSFMISIANIPFKVCHFKGIICSLIIDGMEYRFATYNNTKLVKYKVDNNSLNIILKKGKYWLYIKSKTANGLKLIAPVKGKMEKDILESIMAEIVVTLRKKDEVIFVGTSRNCGLEVVGE